jgi:hypothetical protein
MKNVEIASLRKTTGVGLYLAPSHTGSLYATLWGDFDNVMCNITNVGLATEASIRWGLSIYGINSTNVCNANAFSSGQFAGCWGGLLIDGAMPGSGALSCVFSGTKFDAAWDGTYSPQFQYAASGVFGYLKTSCYIHPAIKIMKGKNTAFHGCYFEVAGSPATFDDGINGDHKLVGVFWNDNAMECFGTGVIDCCWNGVYLYDKGIRTSVTPMVNGQRFDTRLATCFGAVSSGVQSIPAYSWIKVLTSAIQFGDNSYLEWDTLNGRVIIRTPGTYLINAQIEYAGWEKSGTYATCRVTATSGYNYHGSTVVQQGLGVAITPQVTTIMNLNMGDVIDFETLQTQGTNQKTSGSNTYLNIVKIA